jgi:hypothetical protein
MPGEEVPMGHKVVEAIIENGKLTHIDKDLPKGKIKVHIIYDVEEAGSVDAAALVKETAGIYKDIDAGSEAKKMRAEWDRHA